MAFDLTALFPKLVHLLIDPVFVVDKSGHIVFISEAGERLLGYTADELAGRRVLDFIHPSDLAPTLESVSRVMGGQPQTHFENRYLHKDGAVVHIQWSARWSEEHQLRIAVARDVTALRRADQTKTALYRISEAAHAAGTLRALCDGVREVICELFPGHELFLALVDSDTATLNFADWASPEADGWVEQAVDTGSALAAVLTEGQPVLAVRNPERPGHGRNSPDGSGRRDWLGVALVARDAVLGGLVIESRSENTRYQAADRDLLQFIAAQVATAIDRKKADDQLRFMAHHDPLTGLTNRALFYDRLETSLRAADRNRSCLALLYLDLDQFKPINDTWGHETGDEVLREVARRLRRGVRQTDTTGRMGGDEFTVLLTDLPESELAVSATVDKIRGILAAPIEVAGRVFQINASIGVARYPEDGDTAQQLLIKADTNMYLNKHRQ